MKRIAFLLAILCCFLFGGAVSASMILEYGGGVHNYTGSVFSLSVNGEELKNLPLEPIIFNDRALVPVREVFEALGAKVSYKADTRRIVITYSGRKVTIQIDSNVAEIDGKSTKIPDGVTPMLIAKWGESAKTMVPVRFVSDSVGLLVDFDQKSGKISVSEKDKDTQKTQNKITAISAKEENGVVTVTVTASGNVSKISSPSVTASGTLYVDVDDLGYSISNKREINLGAVLAVRLGLHENSVRIAIDTENMKKHNVSISGKNIIFMITADETADITPADKDAEKEDGERQDENKPKPSELSGGKIYVVLDAGHGGTDPGAIGNLMTEEELEVFHKALDSEEPIIDTLKAGTGKTYYEKTIALSVAKKVRDKLENKGVNVIMTRDSDTYPTLDARPEIANKRGAAMFLSIHLNSTVMPVTAANGIEIYYSESNNEKDYGITSKEMASVIVQKAAKSAGTKSRGVKAGNLLVTRKSVMPANLIEIGFMNNPDELLKLISDEYQEKLADGIAEGILEVLGKIKLP
ncbi:MAG: N-acetylmuramoyl-L-alanine amidase [Firmicutes bacterium]|nr:N-acetylmuramoyl-L-alanine amidase [Bacillota bacterium]